MSILIDETTRLLVQGITGREGSFHTERMVQYGTKIVAGTSPGKGGLEHLGVPVYDTVEEAVAKTEANASIIFVPAPNAADAILEAAGAGLPLIICITELIPAMDMVMALRYLNGKPVRLIGPNGPGIISPGKCKAGIMAAEIHQPGNVGVVSRSGTLTYEVVSQLTAGGIGQSSCVGIGGDSLPGSSFGDILRLFEHDSDTKAVVLIGEIGGLLEQEAAEVIKAEMTKPVIALIAGVSAPPGRRMGHAGALIMGSGGTAREKIKALTAAGAAVVSNPGQIGAAVKKVLNLL